MIAWVRFRPYLPIAFWLLVLLLLINGALHGLQATPVLGALPKVTSGRGFLDDNHQRITAAVRECREGRVRSDEYVCAIVGLSNIRENISLKTVAAEASLPCRFLGLGGAGVGMLDAAKHVRLLAESELRPDLVLIGIGPHQLVDTKAKPRLLRPELLDSLRHGDLRNAAIAFRDSFWFYTRREDVSLNTETALLDARAALFQRFDVHVPESEGDHRSPWREMIKGITVEHFSQKTLREEEQFFAELGVFDKKTYDQARKAPEALRSVIEELRGRGSMVVVMLMPEHSQFRRRMPPDIAEVIAAPLRQAFGTDMPPILDLRSAIDDSGLADLTHLNQRGAESCGRLIGAKIREYLSNRPPHVHSEPRP